jgi:hypothetical protein
LSDEVLEIETIGEEAVAEDDEGEEAAAVDVSKVLYLYYCRFFSRKFKKIINFSFLTFLTIN